MSFVRRLQISNVRNISSAKLEGLEQFNVLYGPNGAGKTSVLEALSLLGLGRSFRSRKVEPVIAVGASSLTVFAELEEPNHTLTRMGVNRSSAESKFQINGEPQGAASALATKLPLLVLDSEIFQLIEGGPSKRRAYIDWVLFHVEHDRFYSSWSAYYRALKQRNELLKRGNISASQLAPWNKALIEHGEVLTELRMTYLAKIEPIVLASGLEYEAGSLSMTLRRGWKEGVSLEEALALSLEKDLRYKTTSVGPHRMSLDIDVGGLLARDILSRGQIKMLASQLQLAAANLVSGCKQVNILILLDDLAAETDTASRRKLLSDIALGGFQCFVSGVFLEDVTNMIPEKVKKAVFHVEQGCITKSSNYE